MGNMEKNNCSRVEESNLSNESNTKNVTKKSLYKLKDEITIYREETGANIEKIIDENPTVLSTIKDMPWYKEYKSGKDIARGIVLILIKEAVEAQKIFDNNPTLLSKVKKRKFFKNFVNGYNMDITALEQFNNIQILFLENPEILPIIKNTSWYKKEYLLPKGNLEGLSLYNCKYHINEVLKNRKIIK